MIKKKAKTRKVADLEIAKLTIELDQHELAVLLETTSLDFETYSDLLSFKLQQWLFEEAKTYGVATPAERRQSARKEQGDE
jgi:hypothetical protein